MSDLREVVTDLVNDSLRATENYEGPEFTSPRQLFDVLDYQGLEQDGYKITLEAEHGGEGQGEDIHWIYKVEGNDQTRYLKIEATWVSWDGIEWDYADAYEVFPKQVVKTVFVKEKP